MLQNLRGQRNDLHVFLLAELSRHGSEDTGRSRLSRFIDDYDCVLVEADVRAVFAARFLCRAHNYSARDLRLLYGSIRQRVLDGDDDDVAKSGVASAGSAEHTEDECRLGARVIRDFDHRFLLTHWKFSWLSVIDYRARS